MAQPQSALRALDQSYLMGIGQGPAPARVPRTRGQSAADMLGAAAIGTTPIPIVGDLTGLAADAAMYAAYPAERTYGNYAMSALGMLPLVPGVAAVRAARSAPNALEGRVNVGYDVDAISASYPQTGPGQLNFSNKKKPEGFMEKVLTAEEKALQKARNLAQKDIIFGRYDPYFAVEDRYFANPELYNLQGNTLVDALPATQKTIDQYAARFDTPQIRDNIRQAYERGLSPSSQNWYAMGQLQDEFIRELGPIEGPRMFKERFADGMAATTGGADPTANLLMAAYVNNRKAQGLPLPKGSVNYPHPIGGRYLSGNMAMADKVIMNEIPLTATDQSKRFNFSANFLGDMNRATIDEQMSQLYETGLTAPPGASYGVMERVLGDVGREIGVLPGNMQDVAWAGAKGTQGKPMIQHINEAIERTARVTNKTPREVLVDSIINARSPLYGAGGAAVLGSSAAGYKDNQRNNNRKPD